MGTEVGMIRNCRLQGCQCIYKGQMGGSTEGHMELPLDRRTHPDPFARDLYEG